jgi:SAM-dependent methyltransferase
MPGTGAWDWLRRRVRRWRARPPVGWARLGSLGRVTPISRVFGLDRGACIDRYYIERFLARHAADVRGRVLEVGDDRYIRAFGGDRVRQGDVLHVEAGNPQATIVADLQRAPEIPSDTYDCIILTQTLQFIPDPAAAVAALHRILRPGGVLLATCSGISQISRHDMDRWGEYWRFTSLGLRRLLEAAFPADRLSVEAYGNVLAAVAFLHGLAQQELPPGALDHRDPDYELVVTARAVKPEVGCAS